MCVCGGGALPDFLFAFSFPVQQTTSGIGHRVKAPSAVSRRGFEGGGG